MNTLTQTPTHQEIEIRAYHLYVTSGRQDGRHLDHWLAAERELAAMLSARIASNGGDGSEPMITTVLVKKASKKAPSAKKAPAPVASTSKAPAKKPAAKKTPGKKPAE